MGEIKFLACIEKQNQEFLFLAKYPRLWFPDKWLLPYAIHTSESEKVKYIIFKCFALEKSLN